MWCSMIVTLVVVVSIAKGSDVCESMRPGTDVYSEEPRSLVDFPYNLTCLQTGPRAITLSVSGGQFKGIIAQVREGDAAVGRFLDPPAGFQRTCNKRAVKHSSDSEVEEVSFINMVPSRKMEQSALHCVATVIKQKELFWVRHSAALVKSQESELNALPAQISESSNKEMTPKKSPRKATNKRRKSSARKSRRPQKRTVRRRKTGPRPKKPVRTRRRRGKKASKRYKRSHKRRRR